MDVVESSTGGIYPVEILPIAHSDFKSLSKDRYFFDWKLERNEEIYKLVIKGHDDILGLISLERISAEWRIHIRLLTVSLENVGKRKKYDKIAGNLIAFAAQIAVMEYGELACVSLKPKSSIMHHYIRKYKMQITGMVLSLDVPEILDLINEY